MSAPVGAGRVAAPAQQRVTAPTSRRPVPRVPAPAPAARQAPGPATGRDRLAAALGSGTGSGERAHPTTRSRVAEALHRDARPTRSHRREAPPTRARHRVFTKLHVTHPADPCELQADEIAALVLSTRPAGAHDAAGYGHARAPPLDLRNGSPGGAGVLLPDHVGSAVESAITASGSGTPLRADLRARIEPVLGADLSHVRVREDAASAAAARALGARAFTLGSTIHLGPGASSSDVSLIAHEATHVVQQGLAPARGPPVAMRDVSDYLPDISVSDVIPDSVLNAIRNAVRAIPGYDALTYVVGEDLLTGERVEFDTEALIEAVLTYGPFGTAVGTVLRGLSILQDIYEAVTSRFVAHNLTLTRIGDDLAGAWDEVSITNGIDGNVAIVRRYVDRFLRDLGALVSELIDEVLRLVREAVVAVAEPFLQRPEIAPIWNLAKEVLHYDPLLGVEVDVPTTKIIEDFLTLIGQTERLEQMRERGTLQETADWLDTQILAFLSIIGELGALFSDAWEAIQPQNLPNLLDTLPGLADRAIGVVRRIADFATTLIAKILELVKKALLGWLSEHAHRVPGFHMITVIIGENPFTGEDVPRTPVNLIRGFISLLPDGEATYDELEKSGVVSDAAGRIEAAMARLGISLEMVQATFLGIWDSLSLDDLLAPVDAFNRVVAQFGEPVARIIEFVGVVLRVVVELILTLMNFPSELLGRVVSNAMQAIQDIRRDPIGFLRNTMAALKLGFSNFFDNIGGYLLDGLVAWLFRGLGQIGITLPTDFSLGSILQLVLDVLGLSVEHLWAKLGEHIGPDRVQMIRGAIDTIGGAWQFIADVQREGLPAVWRHVSDQLSNLWQTLLDAALDWITRVVVERAITKVLSFLDPTGIMAVINSAIAIFNAIQSAIEYLRDLLEVLDRYVSTLAAVAAGNVVPGAQMLEQGLAAIIPIAIGFLANQVGLGNIPEKIVEIIGGLRAKVDEALDWLISQALRLGRAALDALGLGGRPEAEPEPEPVETDAVDPVNEPVPYDGMTHHLVNDGPNAALVLHSVPTLVNSIADPALQALVGQYNAIHLDDNNPNWSSRTKVKQARDTKAQEIAAWIVANHPPGAGPGGSAPGLGNIERHGNQVVRLTQSGIELWTLESEHVVPFDVIRGLGEVLGTQGRAPRGVLSAEDRALTTIAIYEPAADYKTRREVSRRNRLADDFVAMAERFAARDDYEDPEANRTMRAWVLRALNREATWYVDLTWEGVQDEHGRAEGASTRGALRAEAGPVPARSAIQAAATQEIADATAIVDAALPETVRP